MGEPLVLYIKKTALIDRAIAQSILRAKILTCSDITTVAQFLFKEEYFNDVKQRPDLILLDLRVDVIKSIKLLELIKTTPELWTIPVVVFATPNIQSNVLWQANALVQMPDRAVEFSKLLLAIRKVFLDAGF